jgi:hypothetical protein
MAVTRVYRTAAQPTAVTTTRTRVYRASATVAASTTTVSRVYRMSATSTATGAVAVTRVYRAAATAAIAPPAVGTKTRVYSALGVAGPTTEFNYLVGGRWVGFDMPYVLQAGVWVTNTSGSIAPPPPPPPPPDPFTLGTTRPDATNTGLTGAPLTAYHGNLVVTVAGTHLLNMDIYGTVKIQAANVYMFNCRVRGNNNFGHLNPDGTTTSGEDFLIDTRSSACVNFTAERCQTKPDYPNPFYSGVIGHDMTLNRCDISESTDGIGIYNTTNNGGPSRTSVLGCYIHDLTFWTQAGTGLKVHPSDTKTHNDGIQQQGNTGTIVTGNNIQGFFSKTVGEQTYLAQGYSYGACNAAIQYNKTVGGTCSLIVKYNWIDGGTASLNSAGGVPGIDVGEASYNRFGHKQINYKGHADNANDTYTIILTATTTMITNGNYYEDNNVPILVRRNQ